MAKSKQLSTRIQADMFQQLAERTAIEAKEAPFLDINLELMGGINKAIREARVNGMSREHIIERMNLCLDAADKVTPRQLNAWTAASKETHNFPSRYLPAFCWATQCMQPLNMLVQCLGYQLVDGRDQLAVEYGNALLEDAQTKRKIKQLQTLITGGLK